MRYPRALGAVAATALIASGISAVQPAHAAPVSPALPGAAAAEQSLRAAADQPPTIRKDRSGAIRTLTAKPGHALRTPAGGFVSAYGAAFGIRDAASMKTLRTDRTKNGGQITRYGQHVGGVPVLGGQLVVVTEADGDVVGATGEISPQQTVSSATRISQADAVSRAVAVVAKAEKVKAADLGAKATKLMYDPALIGAPGRTGLRPAWQVEVTGKSDLRKEVVVDGTLGNVELLLERNKHAKNRIVCDWGNGIPPVSDPATGERDPYCDGRNTSRFEGGPASHIADVNRAFDYSGATYDFYFSRFNRDSIDGKGMQLRSSVRACPEEGQGLCPFENAYWDGTKMVYGQGYASADDVVAHELTHGVTEHTSNLYYAFQSGAINESFSDIFGEFLDQTYSPAGTKDGAAWDWQLGEDLPIGAIRNMANPTVFGDPDKLTSPNWFAKDENNDGYIDDNGGVHWNSGPSNKAAYLLGRAAGTATTFNGQTVTAIGINKSAQIYYRVQSLLTSGADYADLAAALDSSCQQLVTEGVGGITVADCGEVRKATTAVEMTKQPTDPKARALDAPVCPTGATQNVIFGDDMENQASGNWALTKPNWDYLDPARYNGVGYAHSGKLALYGESRWGDNPEADQEEDRIDPRQKFSSATLSAPIAVPAGKTTYLRFAHVFEFETWQGARTDGGRIEYRKNGGAWTDAGSLFTDGIGYGGTLAPATGAPAGWYFVGQSRGYVAHRVDLTSLAGSNVEFRFTIYGDNEGGSYWIVDDVQTYSCQAATASAVRKLGANSTAVNSTTLSWLPPEVGTPGGITEYEISSVPAVAGLPKRVAAPALSAAITGLAAGTNYTFTVKPVSGAVLGAPASVLVKGTSVTLKPAVGSIVYGTRATLNGQVNVVGGGVATNGTARILGRPKNGTTFVQLGTVPVNSLGKFVFTHVPNPSYQYVAHYLGGVNLLGSGSGVAQVLVAPQVSIVAPATARRNVFFTISGATNPARRAVPATLQIYSGGAWRTVASGKTFTNGGYQFSYRVATAGRWPFRVIIGGDAVYLNGVSATKVVAVS